MSLKSRTNPNDDYPVPPHANATSPPMPHIGNENWQPEECVETKAERLVKEYEEKKPLEGHEDLWELKRTIQEQVDRFWLFQEGWDHMSDESLERLIENIDIALSYAELRSLPTSSSYSSNPNNHFEDDF